MSDSRKEQLERYRPLRDEWLKLPENKFCRVKIPGVCTKLTQAPQHVRGRSGEMLLNVDEWVPCCNACNRELENRDKEARASGFKKSRLGPSSKQILWKPVDAGAYYDGPERRVFDDEPDYCQ